MEAAAYLDMYHLASRLNGQDLIVDMRNDDDSHLEIGSLVANVFATETFAVEQGKDFFTAQAGIRTETLGEKNRHVACRA